MSWKLNSFPREPVKINGPLQRTDHAAFIYHLIPPWALEKDFPFKTITCFASSVHIAEDSMKTLHIKYKNLLHIHPLTTVCTLQWVPVSKQLPVLHKQHEYIVAAADRNFPNGQTVFTQCNCY